MPLARGMHAGSSEWAVVCRAPLPCQRSSIAVLLQAEAVLPGHLHAAPDDVQVVQPSAKSTAVLQARAVMPCHLHAGSTPATTFQMMCPSAKPPALLRCRQGRSCRYTCWPYPPGSYVLHSSPLQCCSLPAAELLLAPLLSIISRNKRPSPKPMTMLLSTAGRGSDARSDRRQSPPPGTTDAVDLLQAHVNERES